jgi:predicted aspartyl protease
MPDCQWNSITQAAAKPLTLVSLSMRSIEPAIVRMSVGAASAVAKTPTWSAIGFASALRHDLPAMRAPSFSCMLLASLAAASAYAQTPPPAGTIESGAAAITPEDPLAEVTVAAPEPRYVAPTTRDRIGRVWVPVFINEKGPFRLVLDSGATHTAVTAKVAKTLGLDLDVAPRVLLRGVTGSAEAQTIRVDSLSVGDLFLGKSQMPIVEDAFGGAEGLLGTEGLATRRIHIDFRHDYIDLRTSRGERAPPGFTTIPLQRGPGRLLLVNAEVAGVKAIAIVDTGAQTSLANEPMRAALRRRWRRDPPTADEIVGATGQVQVGDGYVVSPVKIGTIQITNVHVTFGNLHIFQHWGLNQKPVLLIGMDVLGVLDTLIIDYKRSELQLRMLSAPRN